MKYNSAVIIHGDAASSFSIYMNPAIVYKYLRQMQQKPAHHLFEQEA